MAPDEGAEYHSAWMGTSRQMPGLHTLGRTWGSLGPADVTPEDLFGYQVAEIPP